MWSFSTCHFHDQRAIHLLAVNGHALARKLTPVLSNSAHDLISMSVCFRLRCQYVLRLKPMSGIHRA